MPEKGEYFTYRWYAIVIGSVAFVNFVSGMTFIVIGFVVFLHQPYLLLASVSFGCFFLIIFAYYPALEFWRRARPTKIDEMGVTTYMLGHTLYFLPWQKIGIIMKTQYVHPLGYFGDIICCRGHETLSTGEQGKNVDTERHPVCLNIWKSQLTLFPDKEVWIASTMGTKKFRIACCVMTKYARLHMIPMILCDIRPDALRHLRETATPEALPQARQYEIVSIIEHL